MRTGNGRTRKAGRPTSTRATQGTAAFAQMPRLAPRIAWLKHLHMRCAPVWQQVAVGCCHAGPIQSEYRLSHVSHEGRPCARFLPVEEPGIHFAGDDSQLDGGLNGALYFVQTDADGGKSKYGNAGAEMGLGYCDVQCPMV